MSTEKHWLPTVEWATETGMDRGKVRRLRWRDLDLDRDDGRIVAEAVAMAMSGWSALVVGSRTFPVRRQQVLPQLPPEQIAPQRARVSR